MIVSLIRSPISVGGSSLVHFLPGLEVGEQRVRPTGTPSASAASA